MKTLVGGVLAASMLTLAAPASAQTLASDPIVVQRVDVAPVNKPALGIPAVVHVAFQNTAGAAARTVTFLITDVSGRYLEVNDVGTFSKGVTVRHDFHVADLDNGVEVRVVGVTLADGSAWVDSSPEAQPRRQAAAVAQPVDVGTQ